MLIPENRISRAPSLLRVWGDFKEGGHWRKSLKSHEGKCLILSCKERVIVSSPNRQIVQEDRRSHRAFLWGDPRDRELLLSWVEVGAQGDFGFPFHSLYFGWGSLRAPSSTAFQVWGHKARGSLEIPAEALFLAHPLLAQFIWLLICWIVPPPENKLPEKIMAWYKFLFFFLISQSHLIIFRKYLLS